MARLGEYQSYIEEILFEYQQCPPAYGDVDMEILIDREQHHYQLISVGWNKDRRIWGCVIHVDIKNEKIWIQHDGTEEGVANLLVKRGVPKQDIVLAFHAPYKRQYTEFAVN
ncbi:XisI protein [Desulfobacterales bacterium HSG16]|nr:XisI protein [Desulfobacterales bacterium HSG16]